MDGQDDLDELLDEIEESHIPHLSNSKITKSSNSKRLDWLYSCTDSGNDTTCSIYYTMVLILW